MNKLQINSAGLKVRQGEYSPFNFESLNEASKISYLEKILTIPIYERSTYEQVIITRYLKNKYSFAIRLPYINYEIQYREVDDLPTGYFESGDWVFRIGEITLAYYNKLKSEEKIKHVEFLKSLPIDSLSTNDKCILNQYQDIRKHNLEIAKEILNNLEIK